MPLRQGVRGQPGGGVATRAPAPGQATGRAAGRQVPDAITLWALVAIEVLAVGVFRHIFRSSHGG